MSVGTASRLDKLLNLIEGGATSVICKAAAQQVASTARSHPQQLPPLLQKVQPLLQHACWETRAAASECIGLMAQQAQHPTAAQLKEAALHAPAPAGDTLNPFQQVKLEAELDGDLLSLEGFSMEQVLQKGTPLLASGGQEYDGHTEDAELTPAQRLAKQRKSLKRQLGLDRAGMDQLVDTDDLIKDEDLVTSRSAKSPAQTGQKDAALLISDMTGLSARERNQMKRDLKRKRSSLKTAASGKRAKSETPAVEMPKVHPEAAARAAEAAWEAIQAGAWPFQDLCDSLCADLVSPRWEARHGAAMALREVLRSHACSAAVQAPLSAEPSGWLVPGGNGAASLGAVTARDATAAAHANSAWLEDCSARLMCVLALDRFGDYVSDKVVAPVRETAAQALGSAALGLPGSALQALVRHLAALVDQEEWGVRLAGLLGIKYVLAARLDQAGALLPAVLPAVLTGLKDKEDDVRAVSADALLPVVSLLACKCSHAAYEVEDALWDLLLDVDDLSVSTGSAMELLAQLHVRLQQDRSSDSARMRQLWPFLRHNLAAVRTAAVELFTSMVGMTSETGGKGVWHWDQNLLREALRMVYQNILLESRPAILAKSAAAWRALINAALVETLQDALSTELLGPFFSLGGTPAGQALPRHLILTPAIAIQSAGGLGSNASLLRAGHDGCNPAEVYLGGLADGSSASAARQAAGEALAEAALRLDTGQDSNTVVQALLQQVESQKASLRMLCAFTVMHMGMGARLRELPAHHGQTQAVVEKLLHVLLLPACTLTASGASVYQEAEPYQAELRQHAQSFLRALQEAGFSLEGILNGLPEEEYLCSLNNDTSAGLAGVVSTDLAASHPHLGAALRKLQSSCAALSSVEGFLHSSVTAALAAALVQLGHVPAKLNTVVQPLVGGLRREADPVVREAVASAVAQLVILCADRNPSPNDRHITVTCSDNAVIQWIAKNICAMMCGDPSQQLAQQSSASAAAGDQPAPEDVPPPQSAESIARQGAEAALVAVVRQSGAALVTKLPRLWERMSGPLLKRSANTGAAAPPAQAATDAQALLECLQILEVTGPAMHPSLTPHLLSVLPGLVGCCWHAHAGIFHHAAASSAVALASAKSGDVLPPLLRELIPALSVQDAKSGALHMLQQLLSMLGMKMVPYLNMLVVPIMGLTSDAAPAVRATATSAFAAAVALLPLAQGVATPEGLDEEQRAAWHRDAAFLAQLLDNSQVDEFELPMEISGALRPYQRAGISWLAFLRRCGLHGVLADEMGLGKTLQATAIVVSCHVERKAQQLPHLPSLILCPPTLVGHWPHEIAKFVGNKQVSMIQYEGSPAARQALQKQVATCDVVVMSYETVRADIEWVAKRQWLYCVLDEGHIIRNPKAKLTQAVKRIAAQHRLILSGTPIQNSVLELWTLFDFLMPGFLGTHAAFNARYGKALAASKASKTGSAEAQAAQLAMEGLHKQVMPFVMRRTKDQVLKDLPPKIIQDVYVEPSALQRRLYQDFSASSASQQVASSVSADISVESAASTAPHVFQALQYLRKLCSHPLLVLDGSVPQHVAAVAASGMAASPADWGSKGSPMRALHHAPKLQALAELLQESGIIPDTSMPAEVKTEVDMPGSSGHRVLIFAQLKSYLDIVEADVLAPAGISYLRLDGSVEASARFSMVQRFNADPSIPVMLLTTHVGGLGLNLTAADMVIFLEHDWNPMKDLQAMDRAHRLGQTRTVNVYRLLTRGTLEERIMGLQRFKLDVANAVVNTDNASLASMDTSQILDLFSPPSEPATQSLGAAANGDAGVEFAAGIGKAGNKAGLKAVLDGIGSLWDEQQYAEDLSLDAFMIKLKSA